MQGYCMKCRTKREIKEAKAYINPRAIINACKPYERIDNFAKSVDLVIYGTLPPRSPISFLNQ